MSITGQQPPIIESWPTDKGTPHETNNNKQHALSTSSRNLVPLPHSSRPSSPTHRTPSKPPLILGVSLCVRSQVRWTRTVGLFVVIRVFRHTDFSQTDRTDRHVALVLSRPTRKEQQQQQQQTTCTTLPAPCSLTPHPAETRLHYTKNKIHRFDRPRSRNKANIKY